MRAGRSVVVFGDPPEYFEEAARTDRFDRWTLARDERWIERNSTRYVSTYMTGYEDLDAYGDKLRRIIGSAALRQGLAA